MTPNSPLESVYFITLPEGFELSKESFPIDVTIPLPVQKKDSDAPGQFNPEELTQEQILAGILTVLAYDKHNQNLQYYRSIITKARPDIKKELSEAAILKVKNEDFELAEEIFLALQGLDPEDKAITLNMALFFDQRADSYRRSGLTEDADAYDEDALHYYKEAMVAEPAIPDAFFNAGFFYLKQKEYSNAKDAFETYLALTCDTPDEDLGDNGVYKKERAQEIVYNIKNQNMDDARFKAAYDLISNGEEEKGLDQIRMFLQNNPKVWNAWFMLGWGLRRLGRFEDGIQAFSKALEYGGDTNSDTYNEMAICHLETGNYEEAKKALLKALAIEPESTKIISNLGYVALREGNIADAQKYFTTVLEFDPDDKIAQTELAKLENN
ncbi:tetratricopeptide repeat protein [Treponema sp.]|uniref:tetratricopeptide repeat protein n=1 Tax=Treponema sp. TaxID=166 RepID=UPI00298E5A51|nr:tetratricopeptide repeat protein [Treponema sp.]